MSSGRSNVITQLRTAFWHFRHGGAEEVRKWWSHQEIPCGVLTALGDAQRPDGKKIAESPRNEYLARNGFPLPSPRQAPAYSPEPSSALYMLHNALPYHSGGYATRTHGLLTGLRRSGWTVSGVTRLGYPYDMPKMADLPDLPDQEKVGGVTYHHLLTGRHIEKKNPMFDYIERYLDALLPLARCERPAVLHGASNHWNGFAAIKAGRILGVPSVYEVRGLWEITRASRDPEWGRSEQFRYIARMEADAAREASHVIAITSALKEELVRRNVPEKNITLVPNGVDTRRFTPVPRDEDLAAQLGVMDKTVIGYIGTLADYEGLNLLLDAAAQMRRTREDFHVLIVGDGAVAKKLHDQAARQGLLQHRNPFVTFTGRIPHEDVERYYSVTDITPFPRLPVPVTEMVSPLKPFEAMAMGKAVVSASVSALAEIGLPGTTGLLFEKGSAEALREKLEYLLDNNNVRRQIGARARAWVVAERDWSRLASRVAGIYEEITR